MRCFFLALSLICADVFANGDVAVVRRPVVLFPRVAIRRTAVVAPQQAIVVAPQALAIRRQALIVPQVQQYYIQPQIQALQTPCASSLFFSY